MAPKFIDDGVDRMNSALGETKERLRKGAENLGEEIQRRARETYHAAENAHHVYDEEIRPTVIRAAGIATTVCPSAGHGVLGAEALHSVAHGVWNAAIPRPVADPSDRPVGENLGNEVGAPEAEIPGPGDSETAIASTPGWEESFSTENFNSPVELEPLQANRSAQAETPEYSVGFEVHNFDNEATSEPAQGGSVSTTAENQAAQVEPTPAVEQPTGETPE